MLVGHDKEIRPAQAVGLQSFHQVAVVGKWAAYALGAVEGSVHNVNARDQWNVQLLRDQARQGNGHHIVIVDEVGLVGN